MKSYPARPESCSVQVLAESFSDLEIQIWNREYDHVGWARFPEDAEPDVALSSLRQLACQAGADAVRMAARSKKDESLFALYRRKDPSAGRPGSKCMVSVECDPVECGGVLHHICLKPYVNGRLVGEGTCSDSCDYLNKPGSRQTCEGGSIESNI
jgi:hypothetical protein